MKALTFQRGVNMNNTVKKEYPIKVIQYGEGNFLRAFADYMIDVANEKGIFEGSVAIVKPIEYGELSRFEKQNCNYTVVLRGKENGKTVNTARVVTSVSKAVGCYENFDEYISLASLPSLEIVISNTTEAGITLDLTDTMDGIPKTYPGKLTQLLYKRFEAFDGAMDKGLVILPVELIEDNGKKLKECVLSLSDKWLLGKDFINWVNEACVFCSTLVDRIVTGYPRDEAEAICKELGYTDELLDVAEPFGLWVIEADKDISDKFPLDKAGMPVIFTNDQRPYRERKVRILNGAHTSSVLLGWLCSLPTVGECMKDVSLRAFMEKAVGEEIIPFVKLPEDEVRAFADSVFERFENPFIKHSVLDISLNSVSKWKARVLPSFKDYYNKYNALPPALTFSFAALVSFYDTDGSYPVRDNPEVLDFINEYRTKSTQEYVTAVMKNESFWGEDLTSFDGFANTVIKYVDDMKNSSARKTLEKFLRG